MRADGDLPLDIEPGAKPLRSRRQAIAVQVTDRGDGSDEGL
jgi:hypothetical protein